MSASENSTPQPRPSQLRSEAGPAPKRIPHLTLREPVILPEDAGNVVCWICLLEYENDPDIRWVHPCQCKGTLGYAHERCLLNFVDSMNPSKAPSCPQCLTRYRILRSQSRLQSFFESLSRLYSSHVIPAIYTAGIAVSLLSVATAYGAYVFFSFGGRQSVSWLLELAPSGKESYSVGRYIRFYKRILLLPLLPACYAAATVFDVLMAPFTTIIPLLVLDFSSVMALQWPPSVAEMLAFLPWFFELYRVLRLVAVQKILVPACFRSLIISEGMLKPMIILDSELKMPRVHRVASNRLVYNIENDNDNENQNDDNDDIHANNNHDYDDDDHDDDYDDDDDDDDHEDVNTNDGNNANANSNENVIQGSRERGMPQPQLELVERAYLRAVSRMPQTFSFARALYIQRDLRGRGIGQVVLGLDSFRVLQRPHVANIGPGLEEEFRNAASALHIDNVPFIRQIRLQQRRQLLRDLRRLENRAKNIVLADYKDPELSTKLVSAVALPAISAIIAVIAAQSRRVCSIFPSHFLRAAIGGCAFVLLRDVAQIYYRHEKFSSNQRRRVVNCL